VSPMTGICGKRSDNLAGQDVERVLIYRLGSIGDFVISLPCLHLVRRRFPSQRIGLLTNMPVESRAAPASAILAGTGLIDDYIAYPPSSRDVGELRRVMNLVRAFKPDLFVYMVPRPSAFLVMRDFMFFRLSGARRTLGFPFRRDQRRRRPPSAVDGLWESEAQRLARCLSELGDAEIDKPRSWDLSLSAQEQDAADTLLAGEPAGKSLIGLSVGTKQAVKDWGDDNWRAVLAAIAAPDLGLVLVGAEADRARSEALAAGWPGTVVNACGRLTPRQSAALIGRTRLFLCHDSGPMHLAAAVGTKCVALFSSKNHPGEWYPFGQGHRIFYPAPGTEIRPDEVAAAVKAEVTAPRS
jgi:heptosyltransferase-3